MGGGAAGGAGEGDPRGQALALRYQRRLPSEARRRYSSRLVNPLDLLNVLVLLRSHGFNGPFNLDYKPPRTTSNFGVFEVSFPTAVDRFITLWEMAGEVISDPIIHEATEALKAGGPLVEDSRDAHAIFEANKELLTLHELIAHRLVQILIGQHRGRTFSMGAS